MWDSGAVWDPDKAQRNLAKHGVSFEDAGAVLHDPLAAIEQDDEHTQFEERFRITGMDTKGRMLVVMIAVDIPGTIRVVSARRPTRRERHAYEGHS